MLVIDNYMKHSPNTRGIALLITLLLMSVLLGVSASLLNVTLKQFQFSNIGLASEQAFQAANAGVECLIYHDNNPATYPVSIFDVLDGADTTRESGVSCMDASSNDLFIAGDAYLGITSDALVSTGEEQRFKFTWGTPNVCTDVSIYKFYSTTIPSQDMQVATGRTDTFCAQGNVCTVIRSRGYNVACDQIKSLRTIERELTQKY